MKLHNKKQIALLQVLVLVVAIFAFAFMLNTGVKVVSAAGVGDGCGVGTSVGTCQSSEFCSAQNLPFGGMGSGGCMDSGCCLILDTLKEIPEGQPQPVNLMQTTSPPIIDPDKLANGEYYYAGEDGVQDTLTEEDYKDGKFTDSFIEKTKDFGTTLILEKATDGLLGFFKKPPVDPNIPGGATPPGSSGSSISKLNNFRTWLRGGGRVNADGVELSSGWGKFAARLTRGAMVAAGGMIATYVFKEIIFKASSEMNKRGIGTAGIVGTVLATSSVLLGIGAAWSPLLLTGFGAFAAAFAIGVFMLTGYKIYVNEHLYAQVGIWKPLENGESCTKCNDLPNGCTEYQCKSLGTACDLINKGSTEEVCINNETNSNAPTIIKLLIDKLPTEQDYYYAPILAGDLTSPPAKGAKIIYKPTESEGGCIPAYSEIAFGFETDEESECKVDITNTDDYNSMLGCVDEGCYFIKNHSIAIPSSIVGSGYAYETLGLALEENNQYNFFVRCKDPNGNLQPTNYVFQFCVDDGLELNAPTITGTSPSDGSSFKYNVSSLYFETYTSEPADCKWDFEDKTFDELTNNFTQCSQNFGDLIFPFKPFSYGCTGDLAGLRDKEKNEIYIRCKDKPDLDETDPDEEERRIEMPVSTKITLYGTEALIINSFSFNGEGNNTLIKDIKEPIIVNMEVKSFGGADEGKSKCMYRSPTSTTYNDFDNVGESEEFVITNIEKLFLTAGLNQYYIKCYDKAANTDEIFVSFTTEVDQDEPIVVRMYEEQGDLKLITNEEATCVYSTAGPTYAFDDGIELTAVGGNTHYVDWNTEFDLFIKCKDNYGNFPDPGKVTIVARAFE